jgi:dihydrofolate synthase/folylpolyglutamate synthase
MIKTFQEAINNLFKIETVRDYTLDKIIEWTKLFGNPQNDFNIIHVAWTNGKWSVSKMVFSVLKNAWKKVWVFTSPHLNSIRERFETEKWLISELNFVENLNKILELKIEFSYFEKCVLLSFLYFRQCKCEYVILEVWFGWTLDSTNIVNPVITTITSIWYDHTQILWNTLEKISEQKAWIIKPWIPVVINHHNKVIEKKAKKEKSPIIFADKKIETNMLWDFQKWNAAIAYEISNYLGIDKKLIITGLKQVIHNWRLQFISNNLLVDWAHNLDSLIALKQYIDNNLLNKFDNIYYCIWLKKWKTLDMFYDIFWKESNYIWVDFKSEMLEDIKIYKNLEILWVEQIKDLSQKNKTALYVVFGSLYMIGEFLK